jgi:hypothetical protein
MWEGGSLPACARAQRILGRFRRRTSPDRATAVAAAAPQAVSWDRHMGGGHMLWRGLSPCAGGVLVGSCAGPSKTSVGVATTARLGGWQQQCCLLAGTCECFHGIASRGAVGCSLRDTGPLFAGRERLCGLVCVWPTYVWQSVRVCVGVFVFVWACLCLCGRVYACVPLSSLMQCSHSLHVFMYLKPAMGGPYFPPGTGRNSLVFGQSVRLPA